MDAKDTVPEGGGDVSVQTRAPLVPRTHTPSLAAAKQIRRKTSFVIQSDSTGDLSSPHDSIYEAHYISSNNSEENNPSIELVSLPETRPSTEERTNDENARGGVSPPASDPTQLQDVQFRYGHGTILEPIVERKSWNTMRSAARSAEDMTNFPILCHRDSFVIAKSPRRKQSLSLNDLALIKRSYHDACVVIEGKISDTPLVIEVYAEPKTPPHGPLQRPPTPPGMPSWTASQNAPRRRASVPQQNRFQRFFHLPASEVNHSSRVPHSGTSGVHRSVSAPVRRAPRFRAPRSVYTTMEQHPFNSANLATAPTLPPTANTRPSAFTPTVGRRKFGCRVRFTPSATARDSEINTLRTAIESTSASALHPLATIHATANLDQAQSEGHCPHRKGRRAVLKALRDSLNHENTIPPSNEYTPSPNQSPNHHSPIPSPTPPRSTASFNRLDSDLSNAIDAPAGHPGSNSSTTHLMTGALNRGSSSFWARNVIPKTNEPWCWKCKLEKTFDMLDDWWFQCTACLCFVCCGFDVDDDGSVQYGVQSPGLGLGSAGQRYTFGDVSGWPSERNMLGPRRMVLDETAAVGI